MNEKDREIIRSSAVVALIQLKNATKEINEAKDKLISILETLIHKGEKP